MNDLLFICQENRLRSPTCEHVARLLGYTADSAGTAATAIRPLTVEAIERAAYIICMEPFHQRCVYQVMRQGWMANVDVWDIPDKYDYCEPELMMLVRDRLAKYPKGQT